MVPIICQSTALRFHSRLRCHAVRVYYLTFIRYNKEIYNSWQMYLSEPIYGYFFFFFYCFITPNAAQRALFDFWQISGNVLLIFAAS